MTSVRQAMSPGESVLGAIEAPRRANSRRARPAVRGKSLFVGDAKLFVRGVTYGTFRPGPDGEQYPEREVVEADFRLMAESGINAVRTYTVPPRWLLDLAADEGLRVMVGLPWEQHVAFLDERARVRSIEERVRQGVRACAGHPAILCYAVGNEIPAPIVRWHGRRRVERFLERLYRAAKQEDPGALVTYVNYPSTEYLQLPFLDFMCFNVYLESQERLEAYLSRLHNLAGDSPLVMAEIGLDSRRHGEEAQATVLGEQVRTVFAAGCTGTFMFSWTDEWHRGGFEIEDWDFGLTDRDRFPKPALAAVSSAFGEVPFPSDTPRPRISVVVCCHNAAATLAECLAGVCALEYPDYEVILVDDGSTDATPELGRQYGVPTITTGNRGLASARNTGLAAATGEIVAFIDGDAIPDAQWLDYLADTFAKTTHVGVGGPNIPPLDESLTAECVAHAPGGPIHVLLSDSEAEHIPGCNMAFRREALEAIGGFDPQFRAAGDDVDICWRLQARGWTLGFSAGAVVWHRRRNSVRGYLRQQRGYGKAEALLERKWPEKYNAGGHVTWAGRLYAGGVSRVLYGRRPRIYYGTWGSGLFQWGHRGTAGLVRSLPLIPEWYLVLVLLAEVSLLGLLWRPLLLAGPLFAAGVSAMMYQACAGAAHARFIQPPRSRLADAKARALIGALFLLQPLARLFGRVRYGLTPWRRRTRVRLATPRPRTLVFWHEQWLSLEDRLREVESRLQRLGTGARLGGAFDRWDIEVRGGLFGSARLRTLVEEHGSGSQLVRFRLRPRSSIMAWLVLSPVLAIFTLAEIDDVPVAVALLGATVFALVSRTVFETAVSMAALRYAIEQEPEDLPAVLRDLLPTRASAAPVPEYAQSELAP